MRYRTLRGAARARRRFVREFDPAKLYTYAARRDGPGYLVGVYSARGVFLTYV